MGLDGWLLMEWQLHSRDFAVALPGGGEANETGCSAEGQPFLNPFSRSGLKILLTSDSSHGVLRTQSCLFFIPQESSAGVCHSRPSASTARLCLGQHCQRLLSDLGADIPMVSVCFWADIHDHNSFCLASWLHLF